MFHASKGNWNRYEFHVAPRTLYFRKEGMQKKPAFSTHSNKLTLVKVLRPPKNFTAKIHLGHGDEKKLGHILFMGVPVSVAVVYHPVIGLGGKGSAPGFAGWLEVHALRHLQLRGARQVMTSHDPSPARIKQLKRVSLPIDYPVGINKWIGSISRGSRNTVKSTRRKTARQKKRL